MIYTTLYVWAIVAATVRSNAYPEPIREWRANGSFYSSKACHEAARNLALKEYRCIERSTGKPKGPTP